MDTTAIGLAERYQKRLRTHVGDGAQASLAKADSLGKEAKRLELGTVDLAQIYAQSLALLMRPAKPIGDDGEMLERAGSFFQRSLVPIAKVEASLARHPYVESARRDSKALAASQRLVTREIAKREKAEAALAICRHEHAALTQSSHLMHQQCRLLSHRILRAQEEERKSISRELHDEISQILTGISVRLATLAIEATVSTGALKKSIVSTQRLVKKSVDVVHRFARELRPAMLDDLGLVPTLLSLMKEVRKLTGMKINFASSPAAQIEELAGLTRTVIYRVTQEALTNVKKHGKATVVEIALALTKTEVCLTVHDNGNGFDVQRVLAAKGHKSLGIIGMRERAEMIGGSLTIESSKTAGTTVRVTLPVLSNMG